MFKNCYITDVDLSFAFHAKYIYFSKLNPVGGGTRHDHAGLRPQNVPAVHPLSYYE